MYSNQLNYRTNICLLSPFQQQLKQHLLGLPNRVTDLGVQKYKDYFNTKTISCFLLIMFKIFF
ncbi:MAG: hypothetical protein EAZ53_09110 [Bacteroidetes bacterium]|nr:MAG: hypothetical protein EAZ53_09110 [Bacteroidota bacterium]